MHLFKYDSVHGRFDIDFKIEGNVVLFENGKKMSFSQQRDPGLIEWSNLVLQLLLSVRAYFSQRSLPQHFNGGAKKVVLSAPAKDTGIKTGFRR